MFGTNIPQDPKYAYERNPEGIKTLYSILQFHLCPLKKRNVLNYC